MIFAIIDTNVLVSYFLSKSISPPVMIIRKIFEGKITPIFNSYLINEYRKVLSREEFCIDQPIVDSMLDSIQSLGFGIETFEPILRLSDRKDEPIFEVTLATRDIKSYLVTGNSKHFPNTDYVVTPKQMMDILDNECTDNNL